MNFLPIVLKLDRINSFPFKNSTKCSLPCHNVPKLDAKNKPQIVLIGLKWF